ncbi:MAG: DNA gyrase subunit A [Planctomycetota bacterium]|jgi:DNA gyrase subunit A|nr:DNA gyrase subunit A [Planctomycetota bacterium]MDP6989984.1 DNA gyrase subunit A [Planctomycetota bacterium]
MADQEIPEAGERITPRSIEREMKESYLTYALSVIHARALPDVRDGLKPSQRRILVAMNDLNLGPRAKYRKCAKVAGDTSGNYHPHGEAVVYPTLVRMAQDFSLRYPLVDGQGNFGSIDGDPPAAMRYTESRMSGIAVEMLADLDKETVDYEPNYDETRMQPTVLPSRFPSLLCNGSDGIAVGMACSLPPHNLREICAAMRTVLIDPKTTLAELVGIVQGPDFPTGGVIMGRRGIHQAYTTGRGQVRVRARYHVEEKKTKNLLVITEIPYQVRKTLIIEKIVDVVRDGRITGIADVRDESDRSGMRLVVELKRGEDEQVIANQLFKFTPLQTTYSIINLAIDRGQPRTLTLRGLIDAYIDHRKEVIRRRTRFLLRKAEERKHIVEGLRIAVGNIDEVIALIRGAESREDARARLRERFELSERQAQAIVDMRLGSLTGLEREKLEQEYEELVAEIADLNDILDREARVVEMIEADLAELEARFGDERRTEISDEELDGGFDIAELIAEDLMVVTVSRDGYIKRVPADIYRAQGRGGRGVRGSDAKEGDALKSVFAAGTHDYLLCFSNRGKVFWLKVYTLPEGSRTSKGRSIQNLLPMAEGEEITNVQRVVEFDSECCVFFATRRGVVKKTALEAFSRPKKGGIWAIQLAEGDDVVGVGLTQPGDTIILATAGGRSIRFDEAAARQMGRTARGVRGIRLRGDDRVVGMVVADTQASLLTGTENGHGKRTPVEQYPIKGRGGQGVIDIRTTARNGPVVGVGLCRDGDDVMFITGSGMMVRTPCADLSVMGRNTQGVRLVNLKSDDRLVALDVVCESDLERYALSEGEAGEAGASAEEWPATEPEPGEEGEA